MLCVLEDLYIYISLDVSVCTHTSQIEHKRFSRTGRVQKIKNIKENTIFNEHPVSFEM